MSAGSGAGRSRRWHSGPARLQTKTAGGGVVSARLQLLTLGLAIAAAAQQPALPPLSEVNRIDVHTTGPAGRRPFIRAENAVGFRWSYLPSHDLVRFLARPWATTVITNSYGDWMDSEQPKEFEKNIKRKRGVTTRFTPLVLRQKNRIQTRTVCHKNKTRVTRPTTTTTRRAQTRTRAHTNARKQRPRRGRLERRCRGLQPQPTRGRCSCSDRAPPAPPLCLRLCSAKQMAACP